MSASIVTDQLHEARQELKRVERREQAACQRNHNAFSCLAFDGDLERCSPDELAMIWTDIQEQRTQYNLILQERKACEADIETLETQLAEEEPLAQARIMNLAGLDFAPDGLISQLPHPNTWLESGLPRWTHTAGSGQNEPAHQSSSLSHGPSTHQPTDVLSAGRDNGRRGDYRSSSSCHHQYHRPLATQYNETLPFGAPVTGHYWIPTVSSSVSHQLEEMSSYLDGLKSEKKRLMAGFQASLKSLLDAGVTVNNSAEDSLIDVQSRSLRWVVDEAALVTDFQNSLLAGTQAYPAEIEARSQYVILPVALTVLCNSLIAHSTHNRNGGLFEFDAR